MYALRQLLKTLTCSLKSSLTLALLRCILTEGKVYFDGLPTDEVNLDALRSHITIIPQVVRWAAARNLICMLTMRVVAGITDRNSSREHRPIHGVR